MGTEAVNGKFTTAADAKGRAFNSHGIESIRCDANWRIPLADGVADGGVIERKEWVAAGGGVIWEKLHRRNTIISCGMVISCVNNSCQTTTIFWYKRCTSRALKGYHIVSSLNSIEIRGILSRHVSGYYTESLTWIGTLFSLFHIKQWFYAWTLQWPSGSWDYEEWTEMFRYQKIAKTNKNGRSSS
jgi:hypothetical protein